MGLVPLYIFIYTHTLSNALCQNASQPIERCGRSAMKDVTLADDILVLSCEDDYDLCVPFLEKGLVSYSCIYA